MPHDDMTDGFDDFSDKFFATVGLLVIGAAIGTALVLGLLALIRGL